VGVSPMCGDQPERVALEAARNGDASAASALTTGALKQRVDRWREPPPERRSCQPVRYVLLRKAGHASLELRPTWLAHAGPRARGSHHVRPTSFPECSGPAPMLAVRPPSEQTPACISPMRLLPRVIRVFEFSRFQIVEKRRGRLSLFSAATQAGSRCPPRSSARGLGPQAPPLRSPRRSRRRGAPPMRSRCAGGGPR
jgi:hypothetical protein